MLRILAIADDLTGAAEIAAHGLRHGLPSRLNRSPVNSFEPGLTVLDTDTRNLQPRDAAAVIAKFIPPDVSKLVDLIFKKTDSVLRGPILAELHAMMPAIGVKSALLVPQNPSRGRTIFRGAYQVAGIPLAETAFRNDPTYPAWSSNALQLLKRSSTLEASYAEPYQPDPIPTGVLLGGGENEADLAYWGS
jgi:uncharacterized protein YgbK (DUF1537 family)